MIVTTTAPETVAAPVITERRLGQLMVVLGSIGLLSAAVLTIEKIATLRDSSYVPSCSINPVLSCGSVMSSPQAEAFGFPNPLLGIVGFTAVLTLGVVAGAGVTLPRWVWAGAQLGTTAGVLFVHWLIFQSLYRIGALCPYCMVVWAVTLPLFCYVTVFTLQARRPRQPALHSAARLVTTFHGPVLTLWFLAIATLIAQAFWTYWTTVLP